MLKRILDIQGIGLLHQAKGNRHTCHKATLIYSDNGRGKSTLASILKSVSVGDASSIHARRTIDGTLEPKVVFHFDSGHQVSFEGGAWSEQRPEILVFDADFIEKNVYSGGIVSTDHRKCLLEFALGEPAVAARTNLEKATAEAKAAMEKVRNLESQLSGYHIGISFTQFEKLPVVDDIEVKLIELQKRINEASNTSLILSKPVPTALAEPTLNIDDIFAKLAISLVDIQEDAERVVKEHITTLGNKSAESWLSQGQQFDDSKSCPYCAQKTFGNNLLRAYRTHFNIAYSELKSKVADIQNVIAASTALSIIDNFSQNTKTIAAQIAAWAEYVQILPVVFDEESACAALTSLRNLMLDLSYKKQASPAEPIGTEIEKAEAIALWKKVIIPMQNVNSLIKEAVKAINAYKSKLMAENIQQLQLQMQQLQITKWRYKPEVIQIFNQLSTLRQAAAAAEKKKKIARERLDMLMESILKQYEGSINELLKKFGASFTIKNMSANFRGASPRSEYKLVLRGKEVALENGSPSFATALSEGDKRTLAFAFFIASTLADSEIATRIIVIDDPMCSFDRNRKNHTKVVLKELYCKAKQLIVLAHDLYFVRDLRDAFKKEDAATQIATIQLIYTQDGYTDFDIINLDEECESDYFRHHRLLNRFVESGGDARTVAKAIRPMLEGYLHRRFPGLITKGMMFGQVITLLQNAELSSPLRHAQILVKELNEINEYASQFHHDPNSDANTVNVIASELKVYAERALNIVHKGHT